MAKPYIHAKSSAKRMGGEPEEYIKYHDWMDQTKSHIADSRHRAILHSSFGIFLGEQFFGTTFVNSLGRTVSTRNILEQHVLEDLGFIPTIQDYMMNMVYQKWMDGIGLPPSHPKNCPAIAEVAESLTLMENENGLS